MNNTIITPLQNWISYKISIPSEKLNRNSIVSYQINKLKETIAYAKKNSLFYSNHLKNINSDEINTVDDIKKIPFTTKQDIISDPFKMACVQLSDIHRIVTLSTSGTTGSKKRLFFSNSDQELTTDFFANGMKTMVNYKDKVLILMPGQTPGSIGDLLKKGLLRIGVEGIIYGPVSNIEQAYNYMRSVKPSCIVGIPNQVNALVNFGYKFGNPERNFINSVLLSTDYVPKIICENISNNWHCKTFNHYGMTEMGLGGGVDCQALYGYHLREADLFFEIVDPKSGLPVDNDTLGEVVFTTLNREAMPLIRYKTGDLSFFKNSPCPCGTILKTMAPIIGRIDNIINFGEGNFLSLSILDEVLFSFKEILDYETTLTKDENNKCYLNIMLKTRTDNINLFDIKSALLNISFIKHINELEVELTFSKVMCFENTGTTKRIIRDLRHF